MADRVDRAIAAAIADAIVDLEAPAGERVHFESDQLAAVAALYREEATRAKVLVVLRDHVREALLAMEPAAAQPPDWHDAQAAQALFSRVQEDDVAGGSARP